MSMAIRLVLTEVDAWRDAAEPWLRGVKAWRDPRPTVVLTPNRAQGFYLRSRLVAEKRALLGVRFWTPSDARKFLHGIVCPQLRAATKDEQELVARLCAEKLLRGNSNDEASLRSVAQDPAPFVRAHDLLLGAGWVPSRDGAVYGQRLAAEFESTLRKAGLVTQAGLHRQLREGTVPPTLPLARVLVSGFNAVHWPLWDLLQAVCRFSEDAHVALEHPGVFGATLDDLWIGSWESFAGAGYEVAESKSSAPGPLDSLAAAYEIGQATPALDAEIHFIATGELGTQVRALTLQALDYLRRTDCTRLGIVFPEADALALGVATQLRELGIPLNDSLGAFKPGPFEMRSWQAWLELQEEATVRRLIAWLRACDAEGRGFGLPSVSALRAADRIDRALGDSMVDHLDFLADQMESGKADDPTIADFLHKRAALPPDGMLAAYLVTTRDALRRMGWDDLLDLIPETPLAGLENMTLSRRGYLAWLRQISDSRERVRPDGNHFYGKVHLLVYSQLASQAWSHLILTGLNEGVWPRLFEAGAFGSRHELIELNAKVRALNRWSTGQGRQGEGHETVTPGHGHCLFPTESYDLALRDLCSALRATSGAVCLAARTLDDGRNLLPSDFFSHAWQMKTGQVLDDRMFRELADKTAERCREHAPLFPSHPPEPQAIEATQAAYEARHNSEIPFGRYQFAYARPPESPIQLSCKEWETALAHPASVWLSRLVGASPWPEGGLRWRQALGTWTHRWLSTALKQGDGDLRTRLDAAAERDWKAVQKRARDAGVDLYPWWRQMWAQARAVAFALGRGLETELDGKKALTEFTLPKTIEIALPGAARAEFALRGRLDLVLIEPATASTTQNVPDFAQCRAWVIDFKTGHDSGLTDKRLQKGHGLQTALYGLALRALGAESVAISVLTPGAVLKRQLTDGQLLALEEPFRTIDAMHRTGVFGQAPVEDREHGFAPDYPMTTRAIPREVLEAKWEIERGGEGA
jgi:hypothetical protein